MKSNYHIFYESLIRTSLVAIAARSPAHFNRILGEGKSFLLLEEFSNEEARNLAKALQDQKNKTVEVAKALPDEMKTVKSLLNKLASEIDGVSNTEEIAVLSIKGDTKALKKKIENLNSVFMRVGNVTASVVETMINAADNLKAGGFSDDIKAMKLSDLEETGATTGSAEYQKVKKILNAVIKSFAVPEWQTSAIEKGSSSAKSAAGSAWGAFTKFFGNLFAKAKEKYQDDSKGAFAADLRLLTIEQIIKLKAPMEAARAALQGTAQQGGAATTTATTDVASPSGGAQEAGKGSETVRDAQAAQAGAQSAVADAVQQPLGKTVLDVIRKFAEPYKDDRAVMASLDNLVGPTRELLGAAEDDLYNKMIKQWDDWSEGLSPDAQKAIYGDPEADGFDKKKEEMDDAVNKAIKSAIQANLKMESRRRAQGAKLISEACGIHHSKSRKSSLIRTKSSIVRLAEAQIIDRMHAAYLRRLHEVLGETDVRDSRGNVTISPGLKVRHKKTQLEYTVDSVGEDQSGDLVIRLRNPEEPRFEPSYGQKFVGEEAPLLSARPDPAAPVGLEPLDEPEVDLEKGVGPGIEDEEEVEFVIDEKEFEKDYEVK